MEVIILPTASEASEVAARLVARQLREKPNSVLGLATGSTPSRLYQLLARMHREDGLDFSKATTFNLDEYVNLDPNHPASYHQFMEENFFSHVNVRRESVHIPDGMIADVPAHCSDYERAIRKAGGIDLQILGLGSDGHLGFNEPGSSLASRTRIKTLTERTRTDNARFFTGAQEVPHHVITMGLGTIMESRMCLLLAFGKAKAEAVAASVEGPVTASVPGSLLQFHPQAKVLLDAESASSLTRAEYYRGVYQNKPSWQTDL
ncbi:glucosamine-6-phosphate deaminase [bacterium]|jgi:glucosamine-6-phosphate deaminase|nr:glucosamine-6-phosphate deaminase [bacterium]